MSSGRVLELVVQVKVDHTDVTLIIRHCEMIKPVWIVVSRWKKFERFIMFSFFSQRALFKSYFLAYCMLYNSTDEHDSNTGMN